MPSTWGFGVARAAGIFAPDLILAELCLRASKASGDEVTPHVVASYRELAEGLENGSLGLAWLSPILAVEVEEAGHGAVLALPVRDGAASYHTAFISRKGGPRTLAECAGRSIAWVDRESASGYLIPCLHLVSQGIDPWTSFSRETFHGTHSALVEAVLSGRSDVGATFANIDPATKQILNAAWTDPTGRSDRAVHVIDTAGPIPNDAIVASTKLPAVTRSALTRWLLEIGTAEKDLFRRLIRADEFKVIPPSHFEPLKHMVRAARARGVTASS